MKSPINFVVIFGLLLGSVLACLGPSSRSLICKQYCGRSMAPALMATALLALRYVKTGSDLVAAGFLVFAIAEAVLMSELATGPAASVPSFAAGA